MRRTKVGTAVLLVLAAGSFAAPPAWAQSEPVQRVEITGSAIRRIAAEGALPVQTITRTQIEQTGATSVSELVQALPAMQGFTNEAASVGGGGLGFSGASIHNLGEVRTLVLLNGRRLAQFAGQGLLGEQAAVDLNTIPLAAIERIEVLTDGASALYGADAVAGVVNIITRKNFTDGTVSAGVSAPRGGGQERRASIAKGFGDLNADGYSVTVAGSVEKRRALPAAKRKFARDSTFGVEVDGRPAVFDFSSFFSTPANFANAGNPSAGACPANHYDYFGFYCTYNTQSQIDALPERERSTLLLQGSKRLGDDHLLFAEFLGAKTITGSRVPPVPAYFETDTDAVYYRIADAGPREQDDRTRARHWVVGSEGVAAGWDYVASLQHSTNRQSTRLRNGSLRDSVIFPALLDGTIDVTVPVGNQSPEAQQLLEDAQIRGFYEGGETTLNVAQLRGSREWFSLPGGKLSVAAGVSLSQEKYRKTASDLAQGIGDVRFVESSEIVPYSADRTIRAVFAEAVAPITKQFELTGSLRHDSYSDFGSATTAKLSARFQPSRSLLLRGSIGSGFRAPTLPQVNATKQLYGFTAAVANCDDSVLAAVGAAPGVLCPPPNTQYNVYAQGNDDLKPEESLQWTLGVRFEPTDQLSIGADLWQVRVRNAIGQINADIINADPAAWRDLFTTYTDTQGNTFLALLFPNLNLGSETQRGIDLDVRARTNLGFGRLTSQLALTYHLKDKYQLLPGGPYFTSLGRFGDDGEVTHRWQGRFANTLTYGAWAHTLAMNFKSGYRDQTYSADDFIVFDAETGDPIDYAGRVRSHVTFDWQSRWQMNKTATLTAGVLNVFDLNPPRSLLSFGGGFALGYDDRYYDPRGRMFYANVDIKF